MLKGHVAQFLKSHVVQFIKSPVAKFDKIQVAQFNKNLGARKLKGHLAQSSKDPWSSIQ